MRHRSFFAVVFVAFWSMSASAASSLNQKSAGASSNVVISIPSSSAIVVRSANGSVNVDVFHTSTDAFIIRRSIDRDAPVEARRLSSGWTPVVDSKKSEQAKVIYELWQF